MGRMIAFLEEESGASAIEYGLLAAMIAMAAVAAMGPIGSKLSTTFSKVTTSLS